ncbi:MAG TPA: hypothetical protein DD417_16775 [Elusimicrobia bacterium]|nr:hypothetical protein [Elusimicrobiota bacterium]
MKKFVTMMFLAAVLAAPVAKALALEAPIQKGNLEVAALASYQNTDPDEGDKSGTSLLGGSVGYFITQPLEAGSAFYVLQTESAGSKMTFTMLSPFVKWHFFPHPKLVPYVGTGFTVGSIKFTGSDNISIVGFGMSGGADFFLKDNLAIGPELRFDRQVISVSGMDDYGANSITLLMQVKAYLF